MLINKVIFGTVQLGLNYGVNNNNGKPSLGESISILKRAKHLGIERLDTASSYGNAEEIIGLYHQTNKPEYIVNTKLLVNENSLTLAIIKSLKDLNVSRINVLFFHKFSDLANLAKDHTVELEKNRELGNINKVGVSIYTNEEFDYAIDHQLIDVIQIPFNLLDCSIDKMNLLKKAKCAGKEIHARSIFLQGLFFRDTETLPGLFNPLKMPLQSIHELADENGLSVQELAFNFVLHQPFIDFVLFGAETITQLEMNMIIVNNAFSTSISQHVLGLNISNSSLLNPVNWKNVN